MAPTPADPSPLLASLRWRYATKVFDSSRPIAEDTWAALEEALVLTPSSYGLQPWRFLVVTKKGKSKRSFDRFFLENKLK